MTHPKREYEKLIDDVISFAAMRGYATSGAERAVHRESLRKAKAELLDLLDSQLAAKKREGNAWCDASIPPDIPEGRDAYFWIAVRRKDSDKVVTFPAVYANAYPLCSEDPEDGQGAHWSQVAVEYDEVGADILATGWYDIKVGDGDYDQEYQPVCSKGDVILAWCRAPEFFFSQQTPSPDQDRAVSP
jgi:hypothetical protein